MATKLITIHVDDKEITVELKSAKKVDGIWRGEMMGKAVTMDPTASVSLVAFYLYPTCIACVKSPKEIRDMTLEDFMNLVDEADIDLWMETAYELNPQWKAGMKALAEMSTDDQKKTGTLSNGSIQPTVATPTS